ncbi:hypothetical protein NFI96_034679 [Prochilodus magdalenae]|nr:hypothetical protein NFI96_034679 [Prochilodus magdalenae]
MIFQAFIRSRTALAASVGQWRRYALNTASRRQLCSKPHGAETVPAHAQRPAFRMPGYRPSEMDKRILVWSGRFKTKEQIPEQVSFEMIDAARNKVRIKACYVMIALTIAACFCMILLGKEAASRNDNLTTRNMEKKARWREEMQRARDEAALAEKPQ